MSGVYQIRLKDLPQGTPPVPDGYEIYTEICEDSEQNRVFCEAPQDRRKSQGRVPASPKRYFLMEGEHKDLSWVNSQSFPTESIRETMIRQGLEMEILFNMRMTAKAPKCSTILRQEYGMKGKPVDLYVQFCRFRKQKIDPRIAERALKEGAA